MQYSEGQISRIFMLRIDDGEDFLDSINRFVIGQKIKAGLLLFLGALREGTLVTGPEQPVIPPVPHFESIMDGWEVVGMGTIYRGDDGTPKIHYHMAAGKGPASLTGCLREKALTYLVVEVVLFEFQGIYGKRVTDHASGLTIPVLKKEL